MTRPLVKIIHIMRKNLVYSTIATVWCNPDGSAKTPVGRDGDSIAFVPQVGDIHLSYDTTDTDYRIMRQEVVRFTQVAYGDALHLSPVLGVATVVRRDDSSLLSKAIDALMAKQRGEKVEFCDKGTYFKYLEAINAQLLKESDSIPHLDLSESKGLNALKGSELKIAKKESQPEVTTEAIDLDIDLFDKVQARIGI